MDGTNRTAAFCVFGAMYNYTSSLRDILIELTKHIDVKYLDLIAYFDVFKFQYFLDRLSKNVKAMVGILHLQVSMEKEMEEMKTSYGWPILKMVLLLMFGPPIVYLSWKTSNAIRLSTKRLKEEVSKMRFNHNACNNTFIHIPKSLPL